MSASDHHYFVEWKEEFVSQERGHRVVHYYLKDSGGEYILAVVGTERSLRHMFYVVADEFLQVCDTEKSINAGYKWRSRREVVDWLTSMLSKNYIPRDQSKSPIKDSKDVLGSLQVPGSGSGTRRSHTADYKVGLSKSFNGQSSDIIWSGARWTCGKQLKHYPSFCRNGTTIENHSFVFIMAKEEDHYVAHLEDMYEDRKGQKKVKVRWFHHNKEVKGVVPVRNVHPREVFITPHIQVISAECVDGIAIVLTPDHYKKCSATFPDASLARMYLCFRQFKSNRVRPFDLSKLCGYLDQPSFSLIEPNEQDEDYSPDDNINNKDKIERPFKGPQGFLIDRRGPRISEQGRWSITCRSFLSSRRDVVLNAPFKVDEKIEVMCLDSGIRGCWFRCTVLHVSKKQVKVKYDDLKDEEGGDNLEEEIPSFRIAMPDKLGLRCLGRPTIRPVPPTDDQDLVLQVGVPVDAWWSDGWWEGIVVGMNNTEEDWLRVYFPGENLHLNVEKKNLRVSRDWVRNQWIAIEASPDILSAITTTTEPETTEVLTSPKLDIPIDEMNTTSSPSLPSNDSLHERTECSVEKKEPLVNEIKTDVSMMKTQSDAVEVMDTST